MDLLNCGKEKLKFCRENMKLVEDNGRCAKNDSDPRYYEHLVFTDNNSIVEVEALALIHFLL